jgi:predicted aminopeptidase
MKMMSSKAARATVALLCAIQVAGCEIGYYWQATTGHLKIMRECRPVAEVIADSDTPQEVRERLAISGEIVDFAHQVLHLPDNGSYRSYADIDRQNVVTNVVAAPEFSLEPRNWCFPVAGCVSYRGYFDAAKAREFAEDLSGRGDDVYVGGVTAYSTLGRFDDPLLNTMMDLPPHQLAGLIFHELAHQRVYVKGDSQFNEGFASLVEREGVSRWLHSFGDEASLRRHRLGLDRRRQAQDLLIQVRANLDTLYAGSLPDIEKRAAKKEIMTGLRRAYHEMRRSWDGPPYFDHWFDDGLNNARIAAVATYDDDVPAFRALLQNEGADLNAFYARVAAMAALPADERADAVQALHNRGDNSD